ELLAKTIDRDALGQGVSADDRERWIGLLRAFGALGSDLGYRGSRRSAYAVQPGAGLDAGQIHPPLPLAGLLAAPAWQDAAWFTELAAQASPMFEPVGGMHRLIDAFVAQLPPIRYG